MASLSSVTSTLAVSSLSSSTTFTPASNGCNSALRKIQECPDESTSLEDNSTSSLGAVISTTSPVASTSSLSSPSSYASFDPINTTPISPSLGTETSVTIGLGSTTASSSIPVSSAGTTPIHFSTDSTTTITTTSPTPAYTPASAPNVGHGDPSSAPQIDSHDSPAKIAVPMSIGTVIALAAILFLWKHYCPRSFDTVCSFLCCCGRFSRWRKMREKNKQIQRMRNLGILTGDNDGYGGSGQTVTDTYARHMKKFENDAARAREKMSFDTARRATSSPFSPDHKTNDGNDITALPRIGSPWRSPKPRGPSQEDQDVFSSTLSPAGGNRVRKYGLFRVPNDETASMESWEEKWHALGSERGTPTPDATPTHNKGHGMQQTTQDEPQSGPGQSWRKLV